MAKRSPNEEVAIESENRVNGSYDDEEMDDNSEAEEDDMHRHRSKKDKKKKKRKVRIMTASGQTDADRRKLRRKQRELHNDISFDGPASSTGNDNDNDNEEKHEGGGSRLSNWREQNNELWNDVRYTREAVLDSENMDLISSKATREVEKIIQVPRYDAVTLAQNLVKKGSIRTGNTTQFNWAGLGFQVGVCFSSLPSNCSFLYGPLDAEFKPKERKKAERKKKSVEEEELENLEETVPDTMMQDRKKKSGDGNELSAVEKHIKIIGRTVSQRTSEEQRNAMERAGEYVTQLKEEEGISDERELAKKEKKFVREASKVDAVNCLFNPKSFTQTVENIFHFSFTVKEGRSEIKARGLKEAEEYGLEPGPVIATKANGVECPLPKQAIVSLSMKDWRDMCTAYSVEDSDVPHRGGGEETPAKKKARRSS